MLPLAFMAHGHCYLWDLKLTALHVVSSGLIASAYFAISACLIAFAILAGKTVNIGYILYVYAAFVLSCGIGHALAIAEIWHPIYWATGAEKFITAIISVHAAFLTPRTLQEALRLLTAQRRMSDRLRDSEERFMKFMDNSPALAWIKSSDRTMIFASKQ